MADLSQDRVVSNNEKLYNNLLKSGRVSENEIGDFDTFNTLLSDSTNASKLHDNLIKSKKFSESELGTHDDFLQNLDPPNKPQPVPPDTITETQPVVPERQTSYIPEVVAGGKALVGSIPATNKELSINTPNTPKISDSYQVPKPTVIPQGTGDRFKAIDQAQLEKEVGGAQIVQESKPTIQPTESQKQWAENNPNLNAIFSMPGMGVFKDAYIGTKKAIGGLGTTLDVIASNISNNITGGMQTDESGNITAPWEKGYKQDKSEFYQNVRKFEEETPVSSGGATAFIGQLLPQTAALAATVLLRSPSASKAYLASMYGSAFGNGVETYDDYIKEIGKQEDPMDRYLVGMGYGAAEYIGEKIGLDYFLPKGYGKLVSKSLDASPQMAKEIGRSVLENYAKLTKQPFSSVIKKVAFGSQVEGGQEVATELMDIAIDKWLTGKDVSGQEIRDRLVESYGGGALMGAGIAPFASVSQNAATSQRRKDQGTVTISIDEEGLPVEIIETEGKVFGIRPDGEEVKNISEATLNNAATFKTDVFENAIKEFSKTNKITTATIEGKQYTIKNPEDLGIEGKPIFATDETGKVIPVSGKKKDQITDVVTQTQGEIDQAQQTKVDQQALRNGILDPNAQIINEENYEDEGTRVVDFSNGQSKIIYNGQEVIANDINEKDAILNSINDFQKLPEPKVTEVGEVIEPAPVDNTEQLFSESKSFSSQIPKRNEGKREVTDYESVSPQITAGALQEKFSDVAVIENIVSEKISDLQGKVSKIGKVKVISDIDQYEQNLNEAKVKTEAITKQLDYWKSVQSELNTQKENKLKVDIEQKQAETDNLLNIVEEYNATPQGREDKQKASEIQAIAKKLGYQTERNAMNQIRLFDQSGTISKPKVSKNVNIENQNTENVPDITEQLFNNEPIVNSQPENNSQNIQQNEKPVEKVNRIDGQINQLPGENTPQAKQGQGVSEGLEENVNVIPANDINVTTKKQKQKSNSITGKAKEIEVSQTDPKDLALKYFVDGGLVTSDDVLKQFKGDNGERLARMSYTSNENGLSIAQIAHNIEESLPESVREGLGAMDVFNAVEDVISTHNSPIGMAKTLLSKYSIDENQGYSKEWLDQQLLNEESERLAELELWSNYYESGQLPTENELIELFNTEENEQEIDNGRIIESNGPINPKENVENREVLQGSEPSVSEQIESKDGSKISEPNSDYPRTNKKDNNDEVNQPKRHYKTKGGETLQYSLFSDVDNRTATTSVQRKDNSSNPSLRTLKDGEFSSVEQKYSLDKNFIFDGRNKIESTDDVAFLFKSLENKGIENMFACFVKDGKPTIVHISMGNTAGTIMNFNVLSDGISRFSPDKVYLIHNHPSGNLQYSDADIRVHRQAIDAYGDVIGEHIIINLKTGKYATFREGKQSHEILNRPLSESVNSEKSYKVYNFDKQVFKNDVEFNFGKISQSSDIASFISAQRFSEGNKLSAIILDRGNNIKAYIHLSDVDFQSIKSIEILKTELQGYVGRFSGSSVILSGTRNIGYEELKGVRSVREYLEKSSIQLLDIVSNFESKWRYTSMTDEGLFEPNDSYKSTPLPEEKQSDVRFRTEDYSKWKRNNVTYRGVTYDPVNDNGTGNGGGSKLGEGLYTAPSSNKAMAKEYGSVYFIVNGRPSNPLKFNSINEFEIWEQNLIFKKLGLKRRSEFEQKTSLNAEVEKMGYDGIEIKGREMVNYSPENVKYFKTEDEVKNYFNNILDSDSRFRIIGETGAANLDKAEEATTRLDNLEVAREMEISGKDAKTIFLATGWEKGADGKWRYEVPDFEFSEGVKRMINQQKKHGISETWAPNKMKLSEVISDDELFKSYPDFDDVLISITVRKDQPNSGNFSSDLFDVELGSIKIQASNFENFKSILAHEIQHGIQTIEGFAKGGNTNMFSKSRELTSKLFKDITSLFDDFGYEKWLLSNDRKTAMSILGRKGNFAGMYAFAETKSEPTKSKMIQKLNQANEVINENDQIFGKHGRYSDLKDQELYKRLAGEVESRNVQTRLNMTPEERRNTLLQETEDVAREDQIVLMEGLGVSNLESNISEKSEDIIKNRPNIIKAIDKISSELGVSVNFIASSEIPKDINNEIRKRILKGLRVPAYFSNGEIFIISDKLTSVSDALKSYLHELIIHKGLRDVFAGADKVSIIGKQYAKFNDLMSDVFASMSRSQKIEIASIYAPGLYNKNGKIMHNPTMEEKALIGEEFLAHVSENQEIYDEPTLTRWQLFINRLGQIIRKAFRLTSNQFSQKDLLDIVRESRARIKSKSSAGKSSQEGMPLFRATEEMPNTILINGVPRPTLNSNGKPIANSEEGIRNFWKWFGESTTVNEKGQPIVFYHGSTEKFNEFNTDMAYFTPIENVAFSYGVNTIPAYLKINNPLNLTDDILATKVINEINPDVFVDDEDVTTAIGTMLVVRYSEQDFKDYALNNGFDGIILPTTKTIHSEKLSEKPAYIVFKPNQIKSSTGNTGSFSPESNDIRFQIVKDEALNQLKEDLDKITSLQKSTVRLNELEDSKAGKTKVEKQTIINQISKYKEGYLAGASEKRLTLYVIQRNIIKYASDNMNYDQATKSEINQLLTAIKNANTPATISKAFDRIDKIVTKMNTNQERNSLNKDIEALIRQATSPKRSGTMTMGKFNIDDVRQFARLKKYNNEAIRLSTILRSNVASVSDKNEAKKELDRIWDELNEIPDKTIIDEVTLKIIDWRRSGSRVSVQLLTAIKNDLELLYKQAKDAKTEEDIKIAIVRKSDREFISKFIRKKEYDKSSLAKRFNISLNNFTANVMGNWETVMTMLGGVKLREKTSLIMPQVHQEMGVHNTFNEVLSKAYKAYGFKSKQELLHHVQDLSKKDFELIQPNFRGGKVEGAPDKISMMQIMDIYNAIKNRNIENDWYLSYGDVVLDELGKADIDIQLSTGRARINDLISKLSEGDKKFADIMMDKLQEYSPQTNDVFVKLFNMDRKSIEVYWPSSALLETDVDVMEQFFEEGKIPSFFKDRAAHRTPVPKDAFGKFTQHVKESEWIVNMALPLNELNKTFRNSSVRKLIEQNRGIGYYGTIKQHLQKVGLRPTTKELTDLERWGGNLLSNWVVAKIGLSVSVPLKQLIGAVNYAENMPAEQWLLGFTKALVDPKDTFKEVWDNCPYLQVRFNNGYSEALQYVMNATSNLPKASNWHQAIKNIGTIGTRGGDIATLIYGGKPYIDYLIKNGMSKKDAYDKFIIETLRAQQSGLTSTLSIYQNSNNPFARALFTFSNTPSQYMRKMFEANQAFRHGDINAKQLTKVYSIYAVANSILYVGAGMLISAMLTGDEPEDEWEKMAIQGVLSFVGGLPLINDLAESTTRQALGLRVYDDALPVLVELNDIRSKLIKVMKSGDGLDKQAESDKKKVYLKDAIISIFELGGISAGNAERMYNATINRDNKAKERKAEDASDIISEAKKYLKYVRESAKRKDVELYKKLTGDKESLKAATYLNNYNLRITRLKKAIKFYTQSGDDVKVTELQKKLEETYQEIISKYSDVDFPNRYKLSK